MKRLMVLVMTIVLICTLTACKSPSTAISEKAGEKILESATGGKVNIDGDKVTIKGPDGTELTMGTTEWPNDKLGKEIPKLGKGKVTYVANSDAMCMIQIEKIKKSDYEDYLAVIKKAGVTENEINYSEGSRSSLMASDGKGMTYQITHDSDSEELNITASKNEK